LLKIIDHPNIVKIYDSFETKLAIHIIMERIEGMPLMQTIKQPD